MIELPSLLSVFSVWARFGITSICTDNDGSNMLTHTHTTVHRLLMWFDGQWEKQNTVHLPFA